MKIFSPHLISILSFAGEHHAVQCEFNQLTITIPKEDVSIHPDSDLSQYEISWNDPDCGPSERSNATHLVLVAGYSSCGTEAADGDDQIIFRNKV